MSKMFSDRDDSTVRALGEVALIEKLHDCLGNTTPPAPEGMGDDCAVLKLPLSGYQLLTTDSLTYGQHFDDRVGPREAGAKLIKRNLSDVAAMGGQPGPALLNLLCGPNLSLHWLEAFMHGIRECCERYGVSIVGGDVSQLAPNHFSAALTLSGICADKPALRSTAGIGDKIFVTGQLGGSIIQNHYSFEPRIAEGQWLASRQEVTAMMDLTDGLGKDLARLLPDGGAASIDFNRLPISKDAILCSQQDGRSKEEHAFCDGEDYELLFTVAADVDMESLEARWRDRFPALAVNCIGTIMQSTSDGLYIDASNGADLPWQSGFEHFRKK